MTEFKTNVLPTGFQLLNGTTYTGTFVWGYLQAGENGRDSYLGPVIVATRGTPTQIRYVNNLGTGASTHVLAWKNAIDQTVYWADPLNSQMNTCEESTVAGQPPSSTCAAHYTGPIPAVAHLHGGEVPPQLDGGPNAWFTSDGSEQGPAYYTKPGTSGGNQAVYRYPNTQQAAPIWFHDHAVGITRLNVYAGLAGAYLITDPGNPPPANLPGLAEIVPLVIQDRSFDVDGQLYFPNTGINVERPYWIPEFVGDAIVVNGKTWPFREVQPKRYRFVLLNGSNARTYEMFLDNQATGNAGPPIWVIGTDGGYLDAPVKLDPAAGQKLLMMPGERYDIIIDFGGLPQGTTVLMRNTGRTPYPRGEPPQGSTLGRIIQFRVNQPLSGPDLSYDPAAGQPLRSNKIVRLANPASGALATTAQKTRQLTLNEIIEAGGPLEILVNNTHYDGKREDNTARPDFEAETTNGVTLYYSEIPQEGDTEVWEIVNLTADAHPIHTHLTQVQLINRQNFNVNRYMAAYAAAFPEGVYLPGFGPPKEYDFYATAPNTPARGPIYGGNPDITPFLQGPVLLPSPQEAGWKDTFVVPPGHVTRIAIRFAPTDKPLSDTALYYPFNPDAAGHGYVWHCHIIDHEDNEMMRPTKVTPNPNASRSYTDY